MSRISRLSAVRAAAVLGIALAGCATGAPSKHQGGPPDADVLIPPPPPPTVDGAAGTVDATPKISCDLFNQTTCPPDQACDIDFSAPAPTADAGSQPPPGTCRQIKTPGTQTATCMTPEDCASAFTCIKPGECRLYCRTDADCSGPGSVCLYPLGDSSGNTIPNVKLCTDDCDPITNDRCPMGYACHFYFYDPDNDTNHNNGDEKYITDCDDPGGTGGGGATCTKTQDCKAGFACITFTDSSGNKTNKCTKVCDLGSPKCPSGKTCTKLSNPQPKIGSTTYGICN